MFPGEKVKIDNDPACATFMGVGSCVHDAFLDVRLKSSKSNADLSGISD
jgi:hypothetical protein